MDLSSLSQRMDGINNWIEKNPQVTEPNMYEMIDCLTQLGVIAKEQGVVNNPSGLPEAGTELAEAYDKMNKMISLRLTPDRLKDEKFSVNENTELYKYFEKLKKICMNGTLDYPEGEKDSYLEVLKKLGSISLYINQQRNINEDFIYSNEREYDLLFEGVQKYRDRIPNCSSIMEDISKEHEIYSITQKRAILMQKEKELESMTKNSDQIK